MTTNTLNWPCRKTVFNYAAPVMLTTETVHHFTSSKKDRVDRDIGRVSNKLWYYVLETTRILLAHSSMMSSENTAITSIIAHNLRNLYRLFGLDLADKQKWSGVVMPVMHYGMPNPSGSRINVTMDDPTKVPPELKMVSFDDILADFEDEDPALKRYVGHCIYNVVAVRSKAWQKAMRNYRTLDI